MNMKNNLINWKLLLLTTIYSVICIILIRQFKVYNTTTYNDFDKTDSEKIVTTPHYTTTLSNKLPYINTQQPNGKQFATLSRGNIESLNNIPSENDLQTMNESAQHESYFEKKASYNSNAIIPEETKVLNAHLPDYLMYKNVNITNLKDFLESRNSLLVKEPYFSTILSVCKDFNLNPLIMFAITGQEQSFVPKDDENSYKIANNPFNVFNSWKKYNTNIEDATSIAARTVVNLCKNRPDNIDGLTWINRKYSEDQNWSKAVRSIFKDLEEKVPYWK